MHGRIRSHCPTLFSSASHSRWLFTIIFVSALSAPVANGAQYDELESIPAPINAAALIYAPGYNRLVIKNTQSAVAYVDLLTGQTSTRLANTNFTDMTISPSGRYVFATDYGGENTGYGTPSATSFVHRLDLATSTWEVRRAYIAGQVQAVSDTQIILKSLDQWVTFTNNSWGAGSTLVPLNTPSCCSGPGYYAGVYYGNFRYEAHSGRLLHGDSGSSSQEIQAFRLSGNEFVKQEGSGIYGSAQGFGGSVALATDGSVFYYGKLQVDALDVSHNLRTFPEAIHAATGDIAFGDGRYYDAHTGALLDDLGFHTTVYGLNPNGQDFWAYDAARSSLRHFTSSPDLAYSSLTPCRLVDTRTAAAPLNPRSSRSYAASDAARVSAAGGNAGGCGVPADATALALTVTAVTPEQTGNLVAYPAGALVPLASTLSFTAGQVIANTSIVLISPGSGDTFAIFNNSDGHTPLVVDVVGYMQKHQAADCVKESVSQVTAGNSVGTAVATCSAGYLPVGGGCSSDTAAAASWLDRRNTANGLGFSCSARNVSGAAINITTDTLCCRKAGR